jgi:hypothetical protein
MSAARENIAASLAEVVWDRLAVLDGDHQSVLRLHEQLRRRLDETIALKDDAALRAAWNDYREVVASLDKVTDDLETLRLAAS